MSTMPKMNWHDFFTYDAKTGYLIRKALPVELFHAEWKMRSWNTQFAGSVAGTRRRSRTGRRNSIKVEVMGKTYGAHRIVWEMHNGVVPKGMDIDHINRDPWDNRPSNLRVCTRAQNCWNTTKRPSNTSGYKGVSLHSGGTAYVAQIVCNGTHHYLGRFSTPEEAHEAYNAAAIKLRGELSIPD